MPPGFIMVAGCLFMAAPKVGKGDDGVNSLRWSVH